MLTSHLTRLVTISIRRPAWIIVVSLLLAVLSSIYVVHHFRISTDVSQLIETEPAWAARSQAIDQAFPQRGSTLLVVVEAEAPEFAEAAANELAGALAKHPDRFRSVSQPSGGDFFEHNGLLYLSADKVAQTTGQLTQARPLINALAHDPSLTGLAQTLNTSLNLPLQLGQVTLGQMSNLLNQSATVLDRVLANQPAAFSWRNLADSADSSGSGRLAYAFVTLQPMLDYNALEAGAGASDAVRATANELGLAQKYGAAVRLTGAQPLADEEFASVKDGAVLNGVATFIVVLVILWLALRSGKMIVAVFLTVFVGLAITAALGLLMVHALNMISVAFMVLFVGLGVDFGIQFGVRYREERHRHRRLDVALAETARHVAVPLTLAAAATAASFFSFLPTAYRGVSELGLIAGVGMIVAFVTNMTLLPALLKVFAPPGEPSAPGFPALAPVDEYLDRNRKPVLIGTLIVVIGALPLLLNLRFDFNPLHLKDPHTESMETLLALKDAPEASVNDVAVLAPSLADAKAIGEKLAKLPEVGRVTTLDSLIPDDQPKNLELIRAAAAQLLPALNQPVAAPVTDAVRVAALKRLSNQLSLAADEHPGPGDEQAKHLSKTLAKLAQADAATRDRAEHAMAC
ncbi:MMPL family transporter, partial [Caballeronia arationis]|uniref:MMPL family transporter n=1 Tax=Caballeronia arationis TaxID=1777142 RepID=UPI0007885C8C